MRTTHRRALLAASLAIALGACKRDASQRCAHCGMKIDPESPWLAELATPNGPLRFDSPRCALTEWRTTRTTATSMHVRDFYDRSWRDASELRFAVGSDVIGPMGADLVPVDPARSAKFASDHHATRVLTVADVTSDVLASL